MADIYLQITDSKNDNATVLSSETFASWEDVWNKYIAIIKGDIPAKGQIVRLAQYRDGELKIIQETRLSSRDQ